MLTGLEAAAIFCIVVALASACDHWARVRANARAWATRLPIGAESFLAACGIATDDPFQRAVAIAAREIMAELATVPVSTIQAEDSIEQLSELPFWDSLDWLDFRFRVEARASVVILGKLFDEALRGVGHQQLDAMRVRHVIAAVAMSAVPRQGT